MLSILFLGFVISGHAQKIIRLDEMTLRANPNALRLDESSNSIIVSVPERYTGEFSTNPLKFARNNFEIKEFIIANEDLGYDTYDVTFKTSKGHLLVKYDATGEMLAARQSFKDVNVPYDILVPVLKSNRDYKYVANKHIASSKGNWTFDKEQYRLKLKNGSKTKNVKVDIDKSRTGRVAVVN